MKAEELIAKFKSSGIWCEGQQFYAKDIARIIRHFANKPAVEGYGVMSRDHSRSILLREFVCDNLPDKVAEISMRACLPKDTVISIRLEIDELQQLRDNCNKMLEYLKNVEV